MKLKIAWILSILLFITMSVLMSIGHRLEIDKTFIALTWLISIVSFVGTTYLNSKS